MTIITTYTCDKCNHLQESMYEPRQLWEIGIIVREKKDNLSQYLSTPKEHALWCHSCIVELGLLPPAPDTPPAPTPVPTFEDMIREIIQEEIADSV